MKSATTIVLGVFLLAALPAQAALTDSRAFTLCKTEARAQYEDRARIRLTKIRSFRSNRLVTLSVKERGKKTFKAKCEISAKGELISLTPIDKSTSAQTGP